MCDLIKTLKMRPKIDFALLTLLQVSIGLAMDTTCKMQQGKSPPHYNLSPTAKDNIYYKEGQSATSFQALECTCGDEKDGGFYDSDYDDLDDDEKFYEKDSHDWKDSAVLYIHGCEKLEVKLQDTSRRSFGYALDRSVLIFENIEELELDVFTAGERGEGDDENEERVIKQRQ